MERSIIFWFYKKKKKLNIFFIFIDNNSTMISQKVVYINLDYNFLLHKQFVSIFSASNYIFNLTSLGKTHSYNAMLNREHCDFFFFKNLHFHIMRSRWSTNENFKLTNFWIECQFQKMHDIPESTNSNCNHY